MRSTPTRLALGLIALTLLGLACSTFSFGEVEVVTNTPGRPVRATETTPAGEPEEEEHETGQFPMAEMEVPEGGPTLITGELTYTNPFFTSGVAEPIILLEDQAGFVGRDRDFIFPIESQVLGQITSDFYESPFSYSLALPMVPRGTLVDVDNDGEEDEGLMVFAVAYWTNTWGDPFLEKRDQSGGGWSSAYASTRVSDDRDTYLEVYGGKYVIYAPDSGQGFPSGFGEDEMLFTEDDPIVGVPQGWTVVDMDTDPFTFSQPEEPRIDLLEPESIALADFSDMSYTEAFDAMLEKMRQEYAFTEYKDIDWDEKETEFRPRFQEAEQDDDSFAYYLALRDFLWSIPDGHVGMDFSVLAEEFQRETAGGLGMAIRELEDGSVIVTFLTEDGPAEQAGIRLNAEILEIDGAPVTEAIDQTVPWSSPFSTEHTRRLQQLRYVVRFPHPTEVEVRFRNPGRAAQRVDLTTSRERESFEVTSFFAGVTGLELPVEFEVLEEGYGYAKVTDFFDNQVLTIQLWERMIQDLNENNIPGLILDLRLNGGGSGYLADQMAAYFFDEEIVVGNTAFYDDSIGEFYADPEAEDRMFPPREELIYDGRVVVIVGPACSSACEFFSYNMTVEDRATVVGYYPTGGLGGNVEDFVMPEDISVRFTIGRAVDAEGGIHIEGVGVEPDIDVPVTEENLTTDLLDSGDVLLDRALEAAGQPRGAGVTPSGPPRVLSVAESESALENQAPTLEDLANESGRELYEPDTLVYNVPMGRSRRVLWATGWCASPDQFDQNWENIELTMSLDGEEVPLEEFARFDFTTADGSQCRFYFLALTDWPAGEHLLLTEMEFLQDLDDGISDQIYQAGTRVYEYHVYITE